MFFNIDNTTDSFESEDIQMRIDELEALLNDEERNPEGIFSDEEEELDRLRNFKDQVTSDGLVDWEDAVSFVRADSLRAIDFDGVTYYVVP
jgi:hypothetical protein